MKDIQGFEGKYAITMTGRVWSYKSQKFLRPQLSRKKTPYLQVDLYDKNGKKVRFYVHRLVAETYLPNPDNQPQVGHIDENPFNNDWSNLYWTNPMNNNNYGHRNEKISKAMKGVI